MTPLRKDSGILDMAGLRFALPVEGGEAFPVDGVSLRVDKGETVALVGESGCGKSLLALAAARLAPAPPGRYAGGTVRWKGRDVLAMSERELQCIRGGGISYIFQEPTAALNPVMRVGTQVAEALKLHGFRGGVAAECARLFGSVKLPDPENIGRRYPHELSGGQIQRVVMAMALAGNPDVLIADEPTTALDVIVQSRMLDLLEELQKQSGMGILLITHNLGLVARLAHRMYVMYAGQIVEQGSVRDVLDAPRHPYTRGLLDAVPSLTAPENAEFCGIPGRVPSLREPVQGCKFHPRCPRKSPKCFAVAPKLTPGHKADAQVRCHHPIED